MDSVAIEQAKDTAARYGEEPKPRLTAEDGADWTRRAEYWMAVCPKPDHKRSRQPLIVTGHNMSVRVCRAALELAGGFTHHPQHRETRRVFPGDPLPSRIIMLDGSGSVTLDAIDWLAERGIPLLRMDYRGAVVSCIGTTPETQGIEPRLAQAQRHAAGDWLRARLIASWLVREKLIHCRAVAGELPDTPARMLALERLAADATLLATPWEGSREALLGIEGLNARVYFQALSRFPVSWKRTTRHPIPERWRTVGPRSTRGSMSNRFARHPVQAMLNYGYAVLESQIRIAAIAGGFDLASGFLHREQKLKIVGAVRPELRSATGPERSAFVLDLMEPLRPEVDRQMMLFLGRHKFEPVDFIVRPNGECRLHPQLARTLVAQVHCFSFDLQIGPLLAQMARLLGHGVRLRSDKADRPPRPRKVPDAASQERIREARQKAMADPAVRAKISAATREALAKPAVRAKLREVRLGAVVSPETRAKMAEARRKLWADPAKRAKMIDARRKHTRDPGTAL